MTLSKWHAQTDLQAPIIEWDLGVACFKIAVGKNKSSFKHHRSFDNRNYSTRALEVSNVRFYGANIQRLLLRTLLAKHFMESRGFNRISDFRASSMSLDVSRVVGVEAVALINRFHQLYLGVAAGHGDPFRFAVLVHACSSNDRSDRIVISQSLVERLENHATSALATAESSSAMVKREGLPFVGK